MLLSICLASKQYTSCISHNDTLLISSFLTLLFTITTLLGVFSLLFACNTWVTTRWHGCYGCESSSRGRGSNKCAKGNPRMHVIAIQYASCKKKDKYTYFFGSGVSVLLKCRMQWCNQLLWIHYPVLPHQLVTSKHWYPGFKDGLCKIVWMRIWQVRREDPNLENRGLCV